MTIKIGNDYLVWVAAPGGSPTYAKFAGQQTGKIGGSRQTADASHKTSGGVALKVPGLQEIPVDLSFVADLPDASGFGVVQTAYNGGTPVLVAIRKGGATGTASDNIFVCSMYVTTLDIEFGLNGTVSGSVKFEAEAAPTTPLALA